MPNNTANVIAAKPKAAGGIYAGPLGSPQATDSVTPIDAAYTGTGYVSNDAVTETINRSTSNITAWGGDTVKVVQTAFAVTYKFTLIEALSKVANSMMYGDGNVVVQPATTSSGTKLSVMITSTALPHNAYIIDMLDGAASVRIVIPNGQVTDTGDTKYSDGDVIGYEVTITAFPDSNGVNAYKYSNDGVLAAA